MSIESYLRQTGVIAVLALLALAGGIVSDFVQGRFWRDHPLIAGLVANLIVVVLTLAVINEGSNAGAGSDGWCPPGT